MPIIRSKSKSEFLILSNKTAQDGELQMASLGLLTYMLSKPVDWVFYQTELAKHFENDSTYAVKKAIKDLKEHGYLIIEQDHSKDGKFGKNMWTVLDRPTFPPQVDIPTAVIPSADNDQLQRTEVTKNINNKHVSPRDTDKSKKKSAKDEQIEHDEQDVIKYLNTTIQSDSYQSSKDLRTRLKEGYTPEQLKAVIYYCAISCNWMTSTNSDGVPMVTYLRPRTLFGKNNCREYLSDAKALAAANKAKQQKQLSKDSNDIDEEELYS